MYITREELKKRFERNDTPTQEDFEAWIDAFYHKTDKIPVGNIEKIEELLLGKQDVINLTEEEVKQNIKDQLSIELQNKIE